MAAVVRPMATWLASCSLGPATFAAAVTALVPIAGGVVAFAVVSRLLGVAEVDGLLKKLRRRRA
jgi:hypothetical protein